MNNIKVKNNFNLIRLLAALQVLIVHSCNHFGYDSIFIQALKCFPGVPLFFFISGYLIGGTYIKKNSLGLFDFFRNRVLRLYPALLICVTVSIVAVFCTGYFRTVEVSLSQFIIWVAGQTTFYQFYNPNFMRHYGVGVLNGSLWTIAVEVQFYLLTPILFYLLRKFKFAVYLLFVISIIANIYLKLYPDWASMYMKLLSVSFMPWVYMFLLGYFLSYYSELKVLAGRINIWIVFVLYGLSMFLIGSYHDNAMNSINPVSALLLSLLVFKFSKVQLAIPEKIERFIDNYDLSYGIYIYHMPIINTLIYLNLFSLTNSIVITITGTIICAFISWISIERSMLRLKK